MNSLYIYSILFFYIAYLIITDQSIKKTVYILSQLAKLQYEKTKWWIIYNPENPIVKYLMWRRAMKLAKKLEKEFNLKDVK